MTKSKFSMSLYSLVIVMLVFQAQTLSFASSVSKNEIEKDEEFRKARSSILFHLPLAHSMLEEWEENYNKGLTQPDKIFDKDHFFTEDFLVKWLSAKYFFESVAYILEKVESSLEGLTKKYPGVKREEMLDFLLAKSLYDSTVDKFLVFSESNFGFKKKKSDNKKKDDDK